MQKLKLHEDAELTWYCFGRDDGKSDEVIDTNEYLIIAPDNTLLLDPGGTEIFPAVVSALSDVIAVGHITLFLSSHQDPDVMSSLPLWMGLCPGARILMSRLWTTFIAHFGHEYCGRFIAVPDAGMQVPLGGRLKPAELIPAHYCHSSGNFSLFDPNSGILFSGDIGAALMPKGAKELKVADFDRHCEYMEGFHKRWMPSDRAKKQWIERVRALDVRMICPQHGAIFEGEHVGRFLDWFDQLQVGCAI